MEIKYVDISIAILEFLKDAEYHTITATTLNVAEYFHFSKEERNEIFSSRKKLTTGKPFSTKKIYTQTQLMVTRLRQTKFIKDFPGTKNKGIFAITDKGSILLTKNKNERKEILNSEFKKHTSKKKKK